MNKNIKEYRFTLFTNDGETEYIQQDMGAGAGPIFKLKSCKWNLNFGQHPQGKTRLAIESIHCRDFNNIQGNDHTALRQVGNANAQGTQIATNFDKMDEKEVYSIRCDKVNSSYIYDNRPFNKPPIIYMGSLNFKNTNPQETFNYECSKDILNGTFKLYFDDNYTRLNFANPALTFHSEGISSTLIVGITFILYDIRDD